LILNMGSTWKFGSSNYSQEAICLGVRSSWSSLDALVLKAIAIVLTEHLKPHISDQCFHLARSGGMKVTVWEG